ncbi:MAG: maleylacetoacetate isomerase [Proteobacteria bacterium]|nr:maleylacetoacetate isomerase [Pseudomonadota bacterium]MBI3497988.1 maleylacetoacetate isomerase [Pseudomonadota bacterium]
MKLYGYFRSSAAFRVRIALGLKNLDYENVFIHLRKGDQSTPSFLGHNPQGLVPALADGAALLTQSLAIIEYLDETRPHPPLMPSTPVERARVRALAQVVACDIHPIDNLRVLTYLTGDLGVSEANLQRWYNHWIQIGFQAMESMLAGHPSTGRFCHGDTPGLADICLVPQAFNARRFQLDMSGFPTIRRIVEAAMALAPFDQAQPSKQPDAE